MAGRPRRVYETLDGLRAVGALLVLVRHLPEFFGGIPVPESFLAVDIFYLVSGVVMAAAYGERLRAGLSLRDFFVTRLIRLHPLYLLGLAVGLAGAVLNMAQDPNSWWTPLKLIEAVAAGLILFPLVPGLEANGSSLDGPTWTLLPEIVANMVWARTIRWARPLLIGAVLLVCGVGVVVARTQWDTLDVGYGPTQLWGGLARAGWSFFAGLVVHRLMGEKRTQSTLVAWLCLAALALVLAWRPSDAAAGAYEVLAVLVGFPALIALAARFEPGPRAGRLFALLGRTSWGVYILHEPVARLLESTVLPGRTLPAGLPPAVFGIAFAVFLIALSWALDRWFEAPVRKVLSRRLLPPRPAQAA